MGNRMTCVTTLKTGVTQGDANTLKTGASPPPPPKGGGGWWWCPAPVAWGGDANRSFKA